MGRVTPTPTAASAINLSRPFPDVSDPRFPISSAAKRCKVKSTRRNRAGLFVVTADFRALAPRSARARSRPDTATFGYWQVHPIRSVSLLFSLILAVIAIVSSSWIHLAVMRWVSVGMAKIPLEPFNRVMMAVLILFFAHFAGIVVFAGMFGVGHQLLSIGGFSGESVDTVLDYFYFSVVSYTSLGLGDIFPTDHLRLLTGVEALTGLLLIAWSGAYLFAMMNGSVRNFVPWRL